MRAGGVCNDFGWTMPGALVGGSIIGVLIPKLLCQCEGTRSGRSVKVAWEEPLQLLLGILASTFFLGHGARESHLAMQVLC